MVGHAKWRIPTAVAAAVVVMAAAGYVLAAVRGTAAQEVEAAATQPSAAPSQASPAADADVRQRLLTFTPELDGHVYRSDGEVGLTTVGEETWAPEPAGGVRCEALQRAMRLTTAEDHASRTGDLYANLGYLQVPGNRADASTVTFELRVFADDGEPAAIVAAATDAGCDELSELGGPDGDEIVATAVLAVDAFEAGDGAARVSLGEVSDPQGDDGVLHDESPADDAGEVPVVDDPIYVVASGPYLIALRTTNVARADAVATEVVGQLLAHLGAEG